MAHGAAGYHRAGHGLNVHLTAELPLCSCRSLAATALVTLVGGCGVVWAGAPSPWMCDHVPWQLRGG